MLTNINLILLYHFLTSYPKQKAPNLSNKQWLTLRGGGSDGDGGEQAKAEPPRQEEGKETYPREKTQPKTTRRDRPSAGVAVVSSSSLSVYGLFNSNIESRIILFFTTSCLGYLHRS